jgi:hypothetical protein
MVILSSNVIAKLCHEVNRAYCISIGDNSQASWEDAEQWQRDSAIKGVEFCLSGDATPEQTHENWSKDKIADGWVYGPVKDPDKKEHPCLVPYNQLPLNQRTKDYLFKAVVDANRAAARSTIQLIENNFSYHPPKEGQPEKYNRVREAFKDLAYLIDELCPASRERSVAMTELETASFWANASIARN